MWPPGIIGWRASLSEPQEISSYCGYLSDHFHYSCTDDKRESGTHDKTESVTNEKRASNADDKHGKSTDDQLKTSTYDKRGKGIDNKQESARDDKRRIDKLKCDNSQRYRYTFSYKPTKMDHKHRPQICMLFRESDSSGPCIRTCFLPKGAASGYSNFIVIIILALILYLLNGCVAASQDFTFPDIKQGKFAQDLTHFQISWPTRVSHLGEFISHNVHFKQGSSRPRRSVHDPRQDSIKVVNPSSSKPTSTITKDEGITNEAVLHYKISIHPQKDVIVRLSKTNLILAPSALLEKKVSRFRNISDSIFSTLDRHQGCYYSGHVQGEQSSKVALSACGGLTGFLQMGDTEYLIEPVKGHNETKDGRQPHLVYKRSAVLEHLDTRQRADRRALGCGVEAEYDKVIKRRERFERHKASQGRRHVKMANHKNSHSRKRRSISIEKHVETLVVVDTEMVNYYENEDIETYVLTIMNMVATLFHDASIGNAINIVVVRLILMQDPEEELQITHHADKTLKSFCKWQKNINFRDDDHPNHHDVAVLLTRRNICSRNNEPCSTLGLAQVSGLCQPHRTCSINEDTGLSLAWTVAHEIGHK